jgi:hypothetical protein
MGRSRATVKATLANKELIGMFSQVLGTDGGEAQLPAVRSKYERLERHCDRFLRLLELFAGSAVLGRHPAMQAALAAYAEGLRAQKAAAFTAPDLAPHVRPGLVADDYAGVPAELAGRCYAAPRAAKESNLVSLVIITCRNLLAHRAELEGVLVAPDADARDPRRGAKLAFLARGAELTFAPLPALEALNFRQVYNHPANAPADRLYVMQVLAKMFEISHALQQAYTAPDIDVRDFVRVVDESIAAVRKEIPRCDAAFAKIRDSVALLEHNFEDYYGEFAVSGNPASIMESFVLDVAKSSDASVEVTRQFKAIISHYRKKMGMAQMHPQLRTVFKAFDDNFTELKREDPGLDPDDPAPAGEPDSASSDEDDAPGAPDRI